MVNWPLPRDPAIVQAFGTDFRAYFMRDWIVSLVALSVDGTSGNNQSLLDLSVVVQVIGQAVESCFEVRVGGPLLQLINCVWEEFSEMGCFPCKPQNTAQDFFHKTSNRKWQVPVCIF